MNHVVGNKTFRGLSYLFSQLPKSEKWLHVITMTWVIYQIVTAFGMHVQGDTSHTQITSVDELHMYGGLGLMFVGLIFFIVVIHRRRLTDLYPWAFGKFGAIQQDVRALLRWHLPEPQHGGLAATVEGLGLLALFLAIFTGAWWFVLFAKGSALAPDFLSFHKTAVGAIEVYVYGHGIFALLHLATWWRR